MSTKCSTVVVFWLFVVGCSSSDQLVHPAAPAESKILVDAMKVFFSLQAEGKLPQLGPDDHGHSETLPIKAPLPYPQHVTIKVDTDQSSNSLFYVLRRESRKSQWTLSEAWEQK